MNWPTATPFTPSTYPALRSCVKTPSICPISVSILKEEDGAGEIWTRPSDGAPNQVEVSAHQYAAGRSLNNHSRHDLGCILMERDRLWLHQRPAQSLGSVAAEIPFVPSHMRPVKARDPAVMPQSQVQDRDIAEPDTRFRITLGGSEVEPMRDSIGALAAPGGEDGANARVPQRLIPISQPIIVFAGEKMAVPVKSVSANL